MKFSEQKYSIDELVLIDLALWRLGFLMGSVASLTDKRLLFPDGQSPINICGALRTELLDASAGEASCVMLTADAQKAEHSISATLFNSNFIVHLS